MSYARVSGWRRTAIQWQDTVTTTPAGAAYDLTQAGVTVTLTVKRRRSDASALITKTYRGGGAGHDAGLFVTGTNVINVALDAGDTAPRADGSFAASEFLVWELLVTEPDGEPYVVGNGPLVVRASVS